MLVIVGSVASMMWWMGHSSGPVDDGMPTTRDEQPLWPLWMGVGGFLVGTLLLISWGGRGRLDLDDATDWLAHDHTATPAGDLDP
jgi:hypothetical protein